MGSDRTKALALLATVFLAQPVMAQSPGWTYSSLPGEGDRASMGCDRNASASAFTCLVVRCSDDFTIDVHPYSSRLQQAGLWEATIDREARQMQALADDTPYGAQFADHADWLVDRLRHGTFVYLRHLDDADPGFAFIDLAGSFQSMAQALYWCAPRAAPVERNPVGSVDAQTAVER